MSRLAWPALALLAMVAAAVLWPARQGSSVPAGPVPATMLPAPPPTLAVPAGTANATTAAPQAAAPAASGAHSASGVFESDASGRLVIDERTRLAVERLVGLHPADALPALVEAEVQGLPPAAAQAARELALRFDAYQAAQRATFTPGKAPLVPEEGLAELDALVALRTSHFGADAARRMFGADEAVTRRLLQLMAKDLTATLTMEQKAVRAQLRYDQERGVTPAVR